MKGIRYIIALLGCLWVISAGASAPKVEDYTFTHLGIEDGVAGPHIFNICQTLDGVVWWSTKNTVDRYNGSTTRSYKLDPNAPYSHFAGRTIGLVLSDDGKEDLYAFDNKGRIYRYSLLVDDFLLVTDVAALLNGPVIMNHIHVDSDGIWVALESGTFFVQDKEIRPILDRRASRFILRTSDNAHLLCTASGIFRIVSANTRAEFFYACNALSAYQDPGTGRIWLGTFSSGVEVLDVNGLSVQSAWVKKLPANPVRCITSLDPETLLLGVDGFGVFTAPAQGKDLQATQFIHANDGQQGVLHGNGVYSILKDNWDNIFIGTYSGGIDIARPNGDIARILRHSQDRQGPLSNNHINCVAYFPAWGAVLGTDDGVSLSRDGQPFQGAGGLVVLDICEEGDNLLLATFGKGIYKMNRQGKAVPLYSKAGGQLKDDYVYAFCRSADGHLWMGSLMGELVERTPEGFRYYPVQNVRDIIQLPDGKMAVATANGIRLVTPGSTIVEELPYSLPTRDVNRYVVDLFLDGNYLWIASDGGGVYILDLESGETRQFSQYDGLPGDCASSIVKGQDGIFWIGTENGLGRMDQEGVSIPLNHIWALNREFTRRAGLLLPDGRILLGSTDGALVLNPDNVADVSYSAPIHLTGAHFECKDEKERMVKMARLLDDEPELKLSFRNNTFELTFESVNLRFQRDIAYQYRMDEDAWSRLSNEGHFNFAQVESGSHVLHVRTVSRASLAVLDQMDVRVTVAQPLWNTWWMWCIYVLLLIGAFVGAWRVYQLHSRYMRLVLSSPTLQIQTPGSAADDAPGSNEEFVDSVTRIVVEHMAESSFSIDDLCREMGMSRTYLYMRLKAFTGESPQDFIRLIRMEKAALLLRQGEPVANVSEAVGFDNPKYFSTVFKKYFGVSPSKYR